MRIAILSTPHVPTPPKGYGASELIAGHLAEGLVRRGHEVRLFAADESSELVQERRTYPEAQLGKSFDQREYIHVGHAMRDLGGCEIVHNHCVLGGPAFASLSPCPFVTTLHYLSPMVRAFPDAPYLAVSRGQRASLPHVNVVAVIYNGIDLDEYRKSDNVDALERHGVDPRRPIVLFVGRITRQKGIIHLVNAIPEID
ncbi:MAG TPA: glycosyltransferase, partial [Chloroflexota bacterium]|nr:glycosyltransferase [Chloroflexota bacterium]